MFKIGEKVVCVSEFSNVEYGIIYPIKNEIYTIRSIETHDDNIFIRLNEIINPIKNYNEGLIEARFWINRFRKLDYEFSDNLLAEISEAMKSEKILN